MIKNLFKTEKSILFSFILIALLCWNVLPQWSLNIICLSFSNGMVVLSLLVLMRSGLMSFGHGLYYCLGGYAVALSYNFLNFDEAIVLLSFSIIIGFLVAFLIGFFVRKFRGIFFAMLNLAFSMILFGIIVKTLFLGSTDGFGIKEVTFFWQSTKDTSRLNFNSYIFILTICGLAMLLVLNYLNSPMGKMISAIKENEIRSSYLGIDVNKQIHVVYIISGVLASLGGGLMVLLIGHVTPEDTAYWTKSGEFVFVAILSGSSNVFSPIIGSLFFEFIRSYALFYFPNTWQMIIGIILILGIIFLPDGLGSLFEKLRKGKNVVKSRKT